MDIETRKYLTEKVLGECFMVSEFWKEASHERHQQEAVRVVGD